VRAFSLEFRTRGLDVTALAERLAQSFDHSRPVLEALTYSDLEASRVSSQDGRRFTVAWCLALALEHTAQHLGHMEVTRQLWEQWERSSS